MADLKVGQEVFLKPTGNAARYKKDPIPTTITKIGNKYFEVERYGKFHLDTMLQKTEHSTNYKAYVSEQDILDENEQDELWRYFKNTVFDSWCYKLSLASLRKMKEIVLAEIGGK